MKKKGIALLMTAALTMSLVACGSSSDDTTSDEAEETEETTEEEATEEEATEEASEEDTSEEEATEEAAEEEETTASAEDIVLAMITDSGDITDESFNQMTYEACQEWAEEYGVEFTYYKPEADSTEARVASVDQAVADGATVIVMPGYLFAGTVVEVGYTYPDVKFVALDVGEGDILEAGVGEDYTYVTTDYDVTEYYNTDNVYCCTYQEQLAGYMAGYAAVKMGYTHLGFLGGMSVPAVIRYGYGYVQGADDAAQELGNADEVTMEYVYGGQFYGDADITAYMDTWYGTMGVEVVFACGGGIYTSAAEAAAKVDGKVIGVDSDQSYVMAEYGEDMCITSAMKSLDVTVKTVLTAIAEGNWDEYVGTMGNWGLASENPEENYVTLPIDTTLWTDSFTEDDFRTLVASMYDGEIEVSDDTSAMPETSITVNEYGSVK